VGVRVARPSAVQQFSFQVPDPERRYPSQDRPHPGPSAPLLAFVPEPLDPAAVVGSTIDAWTPHAGTYGMGGPGFLGLRVGAGWLVVALWGAPSWFRLNGRPLEDDFWDKHGRERPWLSEFEPAPDNLFVGRRVVAISVERTSMTLTLDGGGVLELSPDPDDRPAFEGTGEKREIGPEDDLRSVVFVAPTDELWI
jgi:hypothetical protein